MVDERLELRLGRGDDAGRRSTRAHRRLDRAEDVRRASAGADADDDVVPSDLERGQVGSSAPVVLGSLLLEGRRSKSAGEERDDLPRGRRRSTRIRMRRAPRSCQRNRRRRRSGGRLSPEAEIVSTAAAIDDDAAPTAAGTSAFSAFMSSTRSSVE